MNDLAIYLTPVDNPFQHSEQGLTNRRLGNVFHIYSEQGDLPSLEDIDLAIIGVNEDRFSVGNEGCSQAADAVRPYLYNLFPGNFEIRAVDLGNIVRGNTADDTYFALVAVVSELLSRNIIPILIGGGQELTYAAYQAYKNRNQIINLVAVDNMFNIGESEGELNSQSYLSHIILHKPNFLFNFSNIGYQTFLVDQSAVDLMKNLYFDLFRLGVSQGKMADIEPVVRNADMLSFDISAIRQSEAPANANATPNGFYGEEACQIARYAGISDKLSCIGFYELNPLYDRNGQTAHLLAQMIWYFIDGYYHRINDSPLADNDNFIRYNVQLSHYPDGIIFFQSKKTDRWWMEVKCSDEIRLKYRRHYLVPCSYQDYKLACENEMPDRWWQTYQKLM